MTIRGRGPREEEDPCAVIKSVPCTFLLTVQEGHAQTMVNLQELSSGNAFRCPNVSASVGLKSFCPWCLKLGGNTETIAIHLWDVHYRMAIVCKICQALTGMSTQNILDHHSGCKEKHDKEHVKHEGPSKAPKKKKS